MMGARCNLKLSVETGCKGNIDFRSSKITQTLEKYLPSILHIDPASLRYFSSPPPPPAATLKAQTCARGSGLTFVAVVFVVRKSEF